MSPDCTSSRTLRASTGPSSGRNGGLAVASANACAAGSRTGAPTAIADMTDSFRLGGRLRRYGTSAAVSLSRSTASRGTAVRQQLAGTHVAPRAGPRASGSRLREHMPHVIRSRLFGREPELALVRALFAQPSETGSVLVVRGDAGSGKSALLAEAGQHAE